MGKLAMDLVFVHEGTVINVQRFGMHILFHLPICTSGKSEKKNKFEHGVVQHMFL